MNTFLTNALSAKCSDIILYVFCINLLFCHDHVFGVCVSVKTLSVSCDDRWQCMPIYVFRHLSSFKFKLEFTWKYREYGMFVI